MQVTAGAEWPTSGGGRQTYSVGLDIEDLREMLGDDKVKSMNRAQILKELNVRAEVLVIKHVADQGGMSTELAASKIKGLQNA